MAAAIAAEVGAHGGVLSVADLGAHASTFPDAIGATYRGVTLWEVPPNGQVKRCPRVLKEFMQKVVEKVPRRRP